MPATQRQAPIDRGALLERVDNDWAMVEILLTLLDEQGPLLEAALRRAVGGGRLDEISRAAHSMASTYGTLAAMQAFHAAKALERTAREGDSSGVAEAVTVLETEIAALTPALAELADECRRRSGEGR
jgi:HPt (histidine-containing phosphotransfer) domain-containing protein